MRFLYCWIILLFGTTASAQIQEWSIEAGFTPSLLNGPDLICQCPYWDLQLPPDRFAPFTHLGIRMILKKQFGIQLGIQYYTFRFRNERHIIELNSGGIDNPVSINPDFSVSIGTSVIELPFHIVYQESLGRQWHLNVLLGLVTRFERQAKVELIQKSNGNVDTSYLNLYSDIPLLTPQIQLQIDYVLHPKIEVFFNTMLKFNKWNGTRNYFIGQGIGLRYRIK